jgi:heme-degrading monooxygenase HmoA
MILEHAILPIRAGSEAEFEAAFAAAQPLIRVQPGFRSLSLSRSFESPTQYLLLVEWDSIEAHTRGFRTSREYQDWKKLLHPFYDPFPVVEHFLAVDEATEKPVSRGGSFS